jgi:hypothetical protein
MATKTKRGQLKLTVVFQATREVIARVIAEQARREDDASYTPPLWARNRTSTTRGVAKSLQANGWDHYATYDSWSVEVRADETGAAEACGLAVVDEFFPEL